MLSLGNVRGFRFAEFRGLSVSASGIALIVWCCSLAGATELDDYVAAPDANTTYSLHSSFHETGYRVDVWSLTSQAWRDPSEVDRTLWKHWLTVVVPDTYSTQPTALLYISEFRNDNPAPTSFRNGFSDLALLTNSITATLRMVPNEPLKFTDETDPRYLAGGRVEDEVLAFAWNKYMITGDPTWLPLLPMTKAAVRAMDAIQAEYPQITGFVVSGQSKRGWTTWDTAAVDAATSGRVEAIIPLVGDFINMEPSLQHQWEAYGYWADAIHDYVDLGLMDRLHTPETRASLAIIDPYAYVDRITIPKYIINSTGDQFFLPDSSQFYFDDLQSEKHLRYIPNTDHLLGGRPSVQDYLSIYYYAHVNDIARPEFSWTNQQDGSLRVETVTSPARVLLWQATNPTERNFRLDTIGAAYTSTTLTDQGGGLYIGAVSPPAQGWTAFLVELEFPSGGPDPFIFTTEVSVVPDSLPFADTAAKHWHWY